MKSWALPPEQQVIRPLETDGLCEATGDFTLLALALMPLIVDTSLAAQRAGWGAVCVPGERSVVPLKEDPQFFDDIATLRSDEEGNRLSHFVMHYPSQQVDLVEILKDPSRCCAFLRCTSVISAVHQSVSALIPQMNCTFDCMWWMRCLPTGVESTEVTMGFCFPKATTERPNFEAELAVYKKRWHLAVEEDNEISFNQQQGLASPKHEPGPFCAPAYSCTSIYV